MITKRDISLLKGLVNSQTWRVLEELALDMANEIQSREKVGDTEWDTAKQAIGDQHESMGIKSYLRKIIDLIQQDNEQGGAGNSIQ